jgi:MoaA/NifB/PqqE/SkfB family radical SAM enzyme
MLRLFTQFYKRKQKNQVPRSVCLESSSRCQLNCPLCKTPSRADKGFLSLAHFKTFIKKNPFIKHVELSNWGEMFLNPELKHIIQHAYKNQVRLTANNGVNFNTTEDETIEALVKYKFYSISVSIDGASQETYKQYRQKGNFDTVLRNIRTLNTYKNKYNSLYPILRWQFIPFAHNYHEIGLAEQKAKELNMTFTIKLNMNVSFAPLPNDVSFDPYSRYRSRYEYEKKTKLPYPLICSQLWNSPHIDWNGDLLGCCVNTNVKYGNVFEEGFLNCLYSKKYIETKKFLLAPLHQKIRTDIPCQTCRYFRDTFHFRRALKKKIKITRYNSSFLPVKSQNQCSDATQDS